MKTFIWWGCMNPVTGTGCTSVDIGANANLELVDKYINSQQHTACENFEFKKSSRLLMVLF